MTESPAPEILAIVVNWNKKDFLQQLLTSLRALGGTPFDVVVIDNASSDGSPQMVRDMFPEFTLVETGANLGGTGGFNRGMRYGLNHPKAYKYLWLLDNDVILHPGVLDVLVRTMESDPKIGLVGSTILFLDEPTRIQEVGAKVDWRTCGLERMGEGPATAVPPGTVYDVDYVAACSMLARTEAIRQVGIWDPNYFFAWDDIEWGVRFGRAGWRVVAARDSMVQHESYGDRRSRSGAAGGYIWWRNALYFARRFAPPEHRFQVLFHLLRMLLSSADNCALDGRESDERGIRWALRDFFAGVTGKPPQELYAKPAPPGPVDTQGLGRIGRVGLIAAEAPEFTEKLYEEMQRRFPGATVDTLLFLHKELPLRGKLQRVRILKMNTWWRRAWLAIMLPWTYELIAGPVFFHRHLFERFVRYSLRLNDDLKGDLRRRDFVALVQFGLRRALLIVRSAWLTRAELAKPLKPVDYFNFNEN